MRNYGQWGKHLELFEMFESFRDDPRVRERMGQLAVQEGNSSMQPGDGLLEGTGAPEGRADFPFFLQTVIRHRMRERFRTVAAKWRSYVGIENAQDFREHTVSQLNGIVGIGPVNENGEYPRLRTSEEAGPSFVVAKHGGIYAVTMEMVINDQTDRILNRTPRELGRMSAEYVSRVVVALIESNPNYIDGQPFMSAARGNAVVGATAQPTEDNFIRALALMKLRRSADGIPFTVEPRRVLTQSPITSAALMRVMRSTTTGVTNNITGIATGAPQFYQGTMNPIPELNLLPADAIIEEPWLNDPEDWYILADAEDRAAFVVAFLRNRQEPFIGLEDPRVRDALGGGTDPYSMEFDHIRFKARHIFGAAVGEPFAVLKMSP
jgi:hypothetical protein